MMVNEPREHAQLLARAVARGRRFIRKLPDSVIDLLIEIADDCDLIRALAIAAIMRDFGSAEPRQRGRTVQKWEALIMLVVTIELWPHGLEKAKEVLADATIANRGRQGLGYTYHAVLRERGDPELGIERREQVVEISAYDRRQSAWNLLLEVLAQTRPVEEISPPEEQPRVRDRSTRRLGFMKGDAQVPDDFDREMEIVEAGRGSDAHLRQVAGRNAAEEHAIGLFMDVLPAAWGLCEHQVEQLLDVPSGWLRAWRNHEVRLDAHARAALVKLGLIQERMRLIATPDRYVKFWHRAWAETSPIGKRTPWQAFEEDGREAITKINQFLASGLQ